MNPLLRNPVYHSLLYNDAHLGTHSGRVAWFDEAVSPFAGFEEGYREGLTDLFDRLTTGRRILLASPAVFSFFGKWSLAASVEGLQFLYEGGKLSDNPHFKPVPLGEEHVTEMIALARLTKPGPFCVRTISFGHYYGVFENGSLAAMTGQRLHVQSFTEISAVCTHPAYLGKGYATALLQHQVNLILSQGQVPFLHVRADNRRAISVYERLGFRLQGNMNFYFLQK